MTPTIPLAIKIRDAVMDQLARDKCGNSEHLLEVIGEKLAYAEATSTKLTPSPGSSVDGMLIMKAVKIVNMSKAYNLTGHVVGTIGFEIDELRNMLKNRGIVVE